MERDAWRWETDVRFLSALETRGVIGNAMVRKHEIRNPSVI